MAEETAQGRQVPPTFTAQDVHMDVVGDLIISPRSWLDAAAGMSSAKRINMACDFGFGLTLGIGGALGMTFLAIWLVRWAIGDV